MFTYAKLHFMLVVFFRYGREPSVHGHYDALNLLLGYGDFLLIVTCHLLLLVVTD